MKVLAAITFIVITTISLLWLLYQQDRRSDNDEWERLSKLQPKTPELFDPSTLRNLPEPVQRYFRYTIRPGTPLKTVAEIKMAGEFGLGDKANPRYQLMQAHQILAAPHGFVWSMKTMSGLPISGSDSGLWTRFRIFGLVPVARLGGDSNHERSAYGRYIAEAAFWTPAALLPQPGIFWEAPSNDVARVTVVHESLTQTIDIHLDSDGKPGKVTLLRWSNASREGTYQLQPFGGFLSDFREVDGYRLPHHVEGGNMIDEDAYFPFFKADVLDIRFPEAT